MTEWTSHTMTALQYKRALDQLGLSRGGAAGFLGVSERTAWRYASGDVEVPPAVAMLLRLMIEQDIRP
jgi:predicted transcriptional regulator